MYNSTKRIVNRTISTLNIVFSNVLTIKLGFMLLIDENHRYRYGFISVTTGNGFYSTNYQSSKLKKKNNFHVQAIKKDLIIINHFGTYVMGVTELLGRSSFSNTRPFSRSFLISDSVVPREGSQG